MVTPQARRVSSELRKCRRCHLVHPIRQFYKNKKYQDGIDTMCRFCIDEYHNSYVRRHRPAIRRYQRERYIPVVKPTQPPSKLKILPEHLQRYIDEPVCEGRNYQEYLTCT